MILDMFSLSDRVAVVTGSDTGLGQGIAKAFVEAGAKVLGVSRSASTATQEMLGEENFCPHIDDALARAQALTEAAKS